MTNKTTRVNWTGISCIVFVLAVAATATLIAPIWAHAIYLSNLKPLAPAPSLQTEIEQGRFLFSDDKHLEEFPYDSISLERTPCFGPCPIYVVTFCKGGKATLVTNDIDAKPPQSFVGEMSPDDYARLCQMVDSARAISYRREYSGHWTDDYSAIMVAKTATRSWTVTDYGRVAPLPVWVLEEMLHSYRQSIDWHRTGA